MGSKHSTLDRIISDQEEKSPEKKEEDLEHLICDVICPHEVIRDPIYGDIGITLLERVIIDTPLFQRLRGKLQLGPTHLVYPGATHTRFGHSIGVLHMANRIVEICNENYKKYANPNLIEIRPYTWLIIRLFALLHDVAHIPFGHTLEREGNLFAHHEWGDEARAETILGRESDIRKIMEETLELYGLQNDQIETIIKDLYDVLTYGKDNDLMDFESPFVIDIVSNTLCADLLDYSVRDMYYCGLTERWGDRFLKYLAVLPLVRVKSESEEFEVKPVEKGGKGRLVLLSYRYERDRNDPKSTRPVPKHDVISEAIDLLRKRYSLSQKVYFHRTKIAASAMVISAVNEVGLKPEELFGMSYEQSLLKLVKSNNERARNLAQNYLKRNLYKVIYEIKYREPREEDPDSFYLWEKIYSKFRDPHMRTQKEIEKEMNLDPGNLVIYCPESGMNIKRYEMLVQSRPENRVKPLRLILDKARKEEMDVIDKYFLRLWRLQVLVNPSKLDPRETNNPDVRCLSGFCEEIFGLPNDVNEELRGTRQDFIATRLHTVAREWDKKHPDKPVPYFIIKELEPEVHRYSRDKEALKKLLIDRIRKHFGMD